MAFNRQVELLVGTKNNEGLKITQLKIDFEVKKTTASGTKTNNAKARLLHPPRHSCLYHSWRPRSRGLLRRLPLLAQGSPMGGEQQPRGSHLR